VTLAWARQPLQIRSVRGKVDLPEPSRGRSFPEGHASKPSETARSAWGRSTNLAGASAWLKRSGPIPCDPRGCYGHRETLGYVIRADSWGGGYATDAVLAVVTFGFTELGLHRISAAIGSDNQASISVAGNLSFVHEGRIRDHVWTHDSWRDSELYSLLAHE
jgi:RimJ/RimL family protein N-acetyltransferase